MPTVDLNCDLGEGFGIWRLGDDDALLDLVSSANVACGFHAGDPGIMRRVTEACVARGVTIGAQVGYRDLAGFGRRAIDVPAGELADDVLYQLGALQAFARAAGGEVAYLKPHGALYTTVNGDGPWAGDQAVAVARAAACFRPGLPVLGLPGSPWLRIAAELGLTPVAEAYADRAYTARGTLVSRRLPGAVLHDPERIARRCVELVTTGRVADADGAPVAVAARSICVHGDTPGAVGIARRVREELRAAGVAVAPFAGSGG